MASNVYIWIIQRNLENNRQKLINKQIKGLWNITHILKYNHESIKYQYLKQSNSKVILKKYLVIIEL